MENEYAVYAVREERNEGEQLVRSNDAGRARLDIANTSWVQTGDRRLFCPRPQQDAPINDEDETAIEVDPMVVHPELDESEAREQNEYIEFGDQAGSNAIILTPHGGDVQPATDRQAEHVSSILGEDVSLWGTKGYRKGGGIHPLVRAVLHHVVYLVPVPCRDGRDGGRIRGRVPRNLYPERPNRRTGTGTLPGRNPRCNKQRA